MDEIDDIMNADAPGEEQSDSDAEAAKTAGAEDEAAPGAPSKDDLDVKPVENEAADDAGDGVQAAGIELDDLASEPVEAGAQAEAGADEKTSKDTDHEGRAASELQAVFDVPVQIFAVLGHTEIEVSDMLRLDTGAIIELDRKIGEAIDIYVNNRLVARGEVVVVENRLGITMTEIIKQETA